MKAVIRQSLWLAQLEVSIIAISLAQEVHRFIIGTGSAKLPAILPMFQEVKMSRITVIFLVDPLGSFTKIIAVRGLVTSLLQKVSLEM